jgi:hypothetical protein
MQAQFLSVLTEFRKEYVGRQLASALRDDPILKAKLGHGKDNKQLRELTSDTEIQCALNFNLAQNCQQTVVAVLLTADLDNNVRCYAQMPEQSELLFKFKAEFPSDQTCEKMEFFFRAKCIIISSHKHTLIVN